MPDNSPSQRNGALAAAIVFITLALWRAFVAWQHYRTSLSVTDDPSIRELEQVGAALEAVGALVLLAHAIALWMLSRHAFNFRWPLALCIGAVCALALGGTLLEAPILSLPGAYMASVIIGAAILSRLLLFNWASLYAGALAGSGLACYSALPSADVWTCLFVVAPCVAWAFLGAGLGRLLARTARHRPAT